MPTITDGLSYLPADDSVPLLEQTLGAMLRERALRDPDRIALIANRHGDGAEVRLTYAELLDEATRAAAGIARLAGPGEFVALWAPNVAEWPIIEYGAALAGVVLVALNPVLRLPEMEYVIGHSRSSVLIHADRSRDYDMAEVAGALAASFPELRTVSLSDRDAWQAPSAADLSADREPTGPQDAVMLQYTSGMTGNPQGVPLRHRSLVNVARLTADALGIPDAAVGLNRCRCSTRRRASSAPSAPTTWAGPRSSSRPSNRSRCWRRCAARVPTSCTTSPRSSARCWTSSAAPANRRRS